MLKSTYKPSPNLPPPLPPDWTEHKAPTGHTYYYNAKTKESTYTRPAAPSTLTAEVVSQLAPPPSRDPHASFFQYSTVPQLSDPATANAFLAQYDPSRQRQAQQQQHGGRDGHRGTQDGRGDRPRPQPTDKPKSKLAIPGCEPWLLVYTKYGRRFAYNPVKNASYWRIPEKIMKGVLELDIKGAQEKAAGAQGQRKFIEGSTSMEPQREASVDAAAKEAEEHVDLDSDYEEVEVTDDEGEGDDEGDDADEHHSKRQRTEEPAGNMPVEFNEDDFAYQLQAMGDDYGLDPGEYDDGDPDAWPEGAEGLPLSDTDAQELFKDLLNDYGINPYSPWEKLVEEGRIIDDSRYTVLNTTKARKEVWEEWSRERIQILKEQRAKEEKKDPKIPYLAFLQQKATPKLYWPEFRRKYKKEAPMRDSSLSDRDREKWYREHINRLKLPSETLKKDLITLLRSVSLRALNKTTHLANLPPQILADVRYISLDSLIRDPLIETYIQTLEPPPTEDRIEEDETAQKATEERRKREKALDERERVVAEEKRRQKRQLEYGKAALREEERELEKAMNVGKKGLQSQLLAAQKAGETGE
ncbi:uncharacterized protein GGS22DRAFT_88139 [Annulohypoxylon maeteangense]|uniref:uncharacterized protein n=1 Tax=Annulohypoxylon maeteangense TaxID=1927788 RepID=UPI0020087B83|nr:uncharacterized protein GGS22DRAFT_88139 [Annulohypoxylon maeteangense]KAI0887702.1 hypothetical protein GGS22DRAFT_88139 [Annulohypoxylon maeteangense]